MRSLEQIASENYIQHTARDIEVMEIVRSEAIADFTRRLHEHDEALARMLSAEFWSQNPRGK